MSSQDLAFVRDNPRCIALPMLRLVLADWRTVLKYMTTMLGKIEWGFENPHWGDAPNDNIDKSLHKLSPWRRNVPYYQAMIAEAIDRIFPLELRAKFAANEICASTVNTGMLSLLPDFRHVQQLMDGSQQRIGTIQTIATNSINIEESRRAVLQNGHLARLTILATIFIPLSFTSSFLSMSADFGAAAETMKLFFKIGVPLTVFALITIALSHPQASSFISTWRPMRKNKTQPAQTYLSTEPVPLGRTIKWPI